MNIDWRENMKRILPMTAGLARLMDAVLVNTHRAAVAAHVGGDDSRRSAVSAIGQGLSLAERIGNMNSAGSH